MHSNKFSDTKSGYRTKISCISKRYFQTCFAVIVVSKNYADTKKSRLESISTITVILI